jgi:hypothetical protein
VKLTNDRPYADPEAAAHTPLSTPGSISPSPAAGSGCKRAGPMSGLTRAGAELFA